MYINERNMMLNKLNNAARNNAAELNAMFPQMTAEQVRFMARFAAAAAAMVKAGEAELRKTGKTLSQAGIEFCLDNAAKMAN